MEAYRKQLQSEGWMKNGVELSTLWLNKISTNYGNNWLQGVAMTLFVMGGCFTIYCWLLGYRIGEGTPEHQDKFRELMSYSFYYLNPLRDNDSIAIPHPDDYHFARMWDFASRIIVAYFAVQTVQAFRKLGKSSG